MLWFLLMIAQIIISNIAYVTDDPTSIINGDLANIEDYPFYVYLREDDESLLCGGSLIQPNIVLTAAHCLGNVEFTVYVGITSEDDLIEAETYEVDDYLIHPLYDPRASKKGHDIGLIRLTRDVVYGVKVRPIDLADFKPPVDAQVSVVGFGIVVCDIFYFWSKQCQNSASTHLRRGTMNVTSTGEDSIKIVSASQVACYGDSGGPMIYDDQLVGVASTVNVYDCTGGNKYIPVDEYIPWIQEYINSSKSDSTTEEDHRSTRRYPYNTINPNSTTEKDYRPTKGYTYNTIDPNSATKEDYRPTRRYLYDTTENTDYKTESDTVTTESSYEPPKNTYAAEILTMQQEILLIQQKIFTIQQKIYTLEQTIIKDCNHDLG